MPAATSDGDVTSGCATDPMWSEDDTNGATWMQGTSMATPITSGVAALVRQYVMEGKVQSGLRGGVCMCMCLYVIVRCYAFSCRYGMPREDFTNVCVCVCVCLCVIVRCYAFSCRYGMPREDFTNVCVCVCVCLCVSTHADERSPLGPPRGEAGMSIFFAKDVYTKIVGYCLQRHGRGEGACNVWYVCLCAYTYLERLIIMPDLCTPSPCMYKPLLFEFSTFLTSPSAHHLSPSLSISLSLSLTLPLSLFLSHACLCHSLATSLVSLPFFPDHGVS